MLRFLLFKTWHYDSHRVSNHVNDIQSLLLCGSSEIQTSVIHENLCVKFMVILMLKISLAVHAHNCACLSIWINVWRTVFYESVAYLKQKVVIGHRRSRRKISPRVGDVRGVVHPDSPVFSCIDTVLQPWCFSWGCVGSGCFLRLFLSAPRF